MGDFERETAFGTPMVESEREGERERESFEVREDGAPAGAAIVAVAYAADLAILLLERRLSELCSKLQGADRDVVCVTTKHARRDR